MSNPYFSIIVVVLNGGKKISTTIHSILKQTCEDYEIVVKDGESTDETLQFIPVDSKIRVISKSDSNLYDGMNQAIAEARGKYISFLNCGETFYNVDVLSEVKNVSNKKEIAVIYGDYAGKAGIVKQTSKLKTFDLIRKPLCHQSMFFNRFFLDKVGNYNIKYRICADYELTIRLYNHNVSFKHVNMVICDFEGGGISALNADTAEKEAREIQENNFSVFYNNIYKLYKIFSFYKIRRWIFSRQSFIKLQKIYIILKNFFTR